MSLHPAMCVTASFLLLELPPEMPEIRDVVRVRSLAHLSEQKAAAELQVSLTMLGVARCIRALEKYGIRAIRWWVWCSIEDGPFWRDPPEDCIGATITPDGSVGVCNPASYFRITPLGQPLFITGRPTTDAGHSGQAINVLQAGGLPAVSDRLFAVLIELGAEGDTAPLIYRGSNKAKYDTKQPGFKRFDVRPVRELPQPKTVDVWPAGWPEEFGICALERRIQTDEFSPPSAREDRWREIAVDFSTRLELKERFRSLSFSPIFRHGGPTHLWFKEFEDAVGRIMVPT